MDDMDSTAVSQVKISARRSVIASKHQGSPNTSATSSSSSSTSSSRGTSDGCAIRKVCVFSDRAEVTRAVTTSLPARRGGHEVILEHLPAQIDHDSVRVSNIRCRQGQGGDDDRQEKDSLVLLEVAPKSVLSAIPAASDDNSVEGSDESSPSARLETLRRQLGKAERAAARLAKQRAWIDKFGATAAGTAAASSGAGQSSDDSSSARLSLQEAAAFLDFQEKREGELDEKEMDIEEELAELRAQIAVAQANLDRAGVRRTESTVQVSVLLFLDGEFPEEDTRVDVELDISYMVLNRASWSPTYDCRVVSSEETAEISYSGKITNNTGEDWNKCALELSTAAPAKGGAPPRLPSRLVRWKTYQPAMPVAMAGEFGSGMQLQQAQMQQLSAVASAPAPQPQRLMRARAGAAPAGGLAPADDASPVLTATVSSAEGASSATFKIPRLATVEADGRPHKVTIAHIPLERPRFTYQASPSVNKTVFLKVTAINGSDFSMLAGSMNIFVDGSFVASTSVKAVPPGDKFALFLGADASVVADFKPVKKTRQRVSYLLSKTQREEVSHVITVKNTKKKAIFCTICDAMAHSETDQIKAKLVEPNLEDYDKKVFDDIRLTKRDHVEWRFNLQPGKSIELPLTYTVEWPTSSEIEYVDE